MLEDVDASLMKNRQKVSNNMERYKPLTPNLRIKIDNAFDRQINELKTCKTNTLVMEQISALQAYKRFIHGLPDGYPIPISEE